MSRLIVILSFIMVCQWAAAHRQDRYDKIITGLHKNGVETDVAGDTVVNYKGYPVKMKSDGDSIYHVGLDLFNSELNGIADSQTLDYIESTLLYEIILGNHAGKPEIEIAKGDLVDFKNLGPNSSFNIYNSFSKELIVEWISDKGKKTVIKVPINYETIRGGTRGEIENAFISKIKQSHGRENSHSEIDPALLEPYGEEDYILPGTQYLDRHISRNIYLCSKDSLNAIWDPSKPLESISNLFIGEAANENPGLYLTIMKHDYGEKELLKTNIESLLDVAEEDGCIPFWGLESFDGTKLTGSLFLYNPYQGYDHVVKIECNPVEIIEGKGEINGTAYLYIPTNNVWNLDEPYITKTEDEKIKYKDY